MQFARHASERILFQRVSRASLISPFLGDSEQRLRQLFRNTTNSNETHQTTILFFDDIDLLFMSGRNEETVGDRDEQRFESRLLGTFLTELDGRIARHASPLSQIKVLMTATSMKALDSALLRPGRCDHIVHLTGLLNDSDAIENFYKSALQSLSITSSLPPSLRDTCVSVSRLMRHVRQAASTSRKATQ